MSENLPGPDFLTVGEGVSQRRIAVLCEPGAGPPLVWLGGFCSDMRATKASALAAFARQEGRALVRFDYSGHGESDGSFVEGTIALWLEDTLAVLKTYAAERPILIGSSMGGWLALLVARHFYQKHPQAPSQLVLIAPAVNFTQELMWDRFSQSIRDEIMNTGVWQRPSAYSSEPTPITRALIEDGRKHLFAASPFDPGCPVHIVQGMKDDDVPWMHAVALSERIISQVMTLTLIPDGDHRLSRTADITCILDLIKRLFKD